MAQPYTDLIINVADPTLSGLLVLGKDGQVTQGTARVPKFTRNDGQFLRLRFVKPDTTALHQFADVDLTSVTVRAAIGAHDGTPAAGTWYLKSGSTAADAVNYNSTAGSLQAALNGALGTNAVTVTRPIDGFYYVTFAATGTQTLLTAVATGLVPLTTITVTRAQTGSATLQEVQAVQLQQNVYALTTSWTTFGAAASTITQDQTGSGSLVSIQSVTFDPAPYGGTWSLVLPGAGTFTNLSWNIAASELQAKIGSNHVVTKPASNKWTFEWRATGSQSAITTTVTTLLVPLGVYGELNLNTTGLMGAFSLTTKKELQASLEIELQWSGQSEPQTVLSVPVIINRDVINPATVAPVSFTAYEPYFGFPSQTGNSGKFLTTDGTTPSWGDAGGSVNTGKTIWVDGTNGNDSTGVRGRLDKPFLTITAAVAASGITSGDVIKTGSGTFAITTSHIVLPSGVSLIGSGMDVTIISSTAITTPILQAGTNSLIRDLTVSATLTDGTFQYPVGVSGSSVTGVTLINVKTTGDTDGLYVAGDDTAGTVFMRCFNCNFTSKFDAINVTRGGVAFYDCIAVATGPSSTASGIATAVCASGVSSHPPRIYWHGGSVSASGAGGSGVNSAFELRGGSLSGGLIEIHNPKVHLGTDGLNNYDLNNASSGASTINYNNVTRDDGAALTIFGTTVTNISRSQPLDAALTALAGGSDFVQFTGPTSSTKVFTLPDASSTLLYSGGALGTPSSGNASNLTSLTAGNITGSTTVGRNILSLTNPSAISFVKIAADNSVSARTPAQVLSDIGAQASGSYAASGTNSDITSTTALNTITGNTAVSITAGGSNQNASISGSGTGIVAINQGYFQNPIYLFDTVAHAAAKSYVNAFLAYDSNLGGAYMANNLGVTFSANGNLNSFDKVAGLNKASGGNAVTESNDGTIGHLGAHLASRWVVPKTANYTVVTADKSTLFTNTGAGGAINFSLPAAVVGNTYTFSVEAAQTLTCTANGTDTIRMAATVSGAGGTIASATIGTVWTIVCTQTGKWIVISHEGSPTIT